MRIDQVLQQAIQMHRGDELGRGLVSIDDRAIEEEKQGLDIDTMLLAYLADAWSPKPKGMPKREMMSSALALPKMTSLMRV